MKKRAVAIVMAAIMSVGTLSACGSSLSTANTDAHTSEVSDKAAKGGPEASGETVKIQFMHSQVEEERQQAVKQIISEFQKKYPNIEVESVPVNEDDYDSKITSQGASGQLSAVIEYSQDQAKSSVLNQFTDTDAVKEVIESKSEDQFYEGALHAVTTEDGDSYSCVPIASWVQGIWVNKKMLSDKGFEVPETWDDVEKIAEAFNDPDHKMYGIAIPTGENAFTEQVFSQFAISNGANVFDADKKVTVDTPEMKEALDYYQKLASFSMPGSTEVEDVRDAFVGQYAPMAMYSTYILGAVDEAGFIDDLALTLPKNKEEAAYGCVVGLGLASGLSDAERDAAKKFVSFLLEDNYNAEWLNMAPGGMWPVIRTVSDNNVYKNYEGRKNFEQLSDQVSNAVLNLKFFGNVDGHNFAEMGDITNKNIISHMVNEVTVQNADPAAELQTAQSEVEDLIR